MTAGLGGPGATDINDGIRITTAGTALAVSMVDAGALGLSIETTTAAGAWSADAGAVVAAPGVYVLLKDCWTTQLSSNKLLRDFVNGVDLRATKFGGSPVTGGMAQADGTNVTYDALQAAAQSNGAQSIAPWDNGQNGATAVYGSSFCFTCHQGRIGNWVGGTMLDADFGTIAQIPGAAAAYPSLGGATVATAVSTV